MLPYDKRWYKDAIIYGVDVDFFRDANGDGVGDIQGIIEKLDYIAGLGANCIWLMPVYPSPMRDNGYDVCNYYAVRDSAGTLGDLVELVERARERGLRIMLDIVFNHTSSEHPWFERARHDPNSATRDFYIWSDHQADAIPGKETIFPGQEDSVWSYDDCSDSWYYHRFYAFEPSLNLTNETLREELQRILGFYLQCGAAGFRIDSASHMVEAKGLPEAPVEGGHEVLKELRRVVDSRGAGALLLGEADATRDKIGKFFGDGDELQGLFNFLLCNYAFLAFARQQAEPILTILKSLPDIPPTCQWFNFLRNLDELDLERLTRAQRDEVYKAFAPEPDMQIFGRGIRRRLAPMLDGNLDRLKMAYSLLFSLPGSPVIIYGDELGMGEDLSRKGRSAVRSPMQWSAEQNAGFTAAKPTAPVIDSGDFSFRKVNAAAQDADPDSLLNWIRKLAALRRTHSVIGYARHEPLETGRVELLALRYSDRGRVVTAIHNLSPEPQSAEFERSPFKGGSVCLSKNADVAVESGRVSLDAYGCAWIVSGDEGVTPSELARLRETKLANRQAEAAEA